MPQSRESGAEGNAYGHRMAKVLAKLMGLTLVKTGSNEVEWRGECAVIKSCGVRTNSFGVTATMLQRLDTILACFEDDRGEVQVLALSAAKFRAAMHDSRSSGAVGGRVKIVRKVYAIQHGIPVARFTPMQIDAADLD